MRDRRAALFRRVFELLVAADLIHFVPPKAPGDEAIFYFPRFNEEGKPLLTSTETELIANFTNNDVNMNTNFRVDLTKLMVNGVIDF